MNMSERNADVCWLLLLLVVVAGCGREVGTEPTQRVVTEAQPPTRHIQLDGQPNFRDIGGYTTSDGQTVKWRQVFRSGELPKLTDDDLRVLETLGLRTVVNFLTEKEIAAHGQDRLPDGVREVALPMEAGNLGELAHEILKARKTGDFSGVPPEINPDIHRFLIDEGREYYASFLREVAEPENRPLVLHCSHGIHRTGTATAILLSALGVPWDDVRKDYLLSNEFRKQEVDLRIEELARLDADNRGIPFDEVDQTNIKAFYILDGSYIDASLEAAVKEYGSMDAYIRNGLGLSGEEIQHLRRELLDK